MTKLLTQIDLAIPQDARTTRYWRVLVADFVGEKTMQLLWPEAPPNDADGEAAAATPD